MLGARRDGRGSADGLRDNTVHGNNDTVGAANAVDKVATGLALSKTAGLLAATLME